MNALARFLNLSVRVGRLFGIPISLHVTILFFLLPAFTGRAMGFGFAIEYALGIVLSILLHELGHALTAKAYGLGGLSIMLHGFGGFATSSGYRSPRQDLVVTLAGPAATFAWGGLCLLTGHWGLAHAGNEGVFTQAFLLLVLGRTNILLGFLNLVPVLPWDGGHALRAVFAHRMSERKAARLAAHIGLVLGAILLVYGLFVGGFFGLFAFVGVLTCYQILAQSGGIRFGEYLADRRHAKEMEAVRQREAARQEEFLGGVKDREREREEKERLRKLFESSGMDDPR